VTEERVNFARWRHVDDDTAARFIEALDAMDGATEPMESDSVTSNCANCGHDRADHIYEEGACRPGFICQRECDKFVSAIQKPDTVTITISRKDANLLADYMELDYPEMTRIARAARAALEGER